MISLSTPVKVVLMVALLAAFPPVFFTSITRQEGLCISLGLLLFYLARGTVVVTKKARQGRQDLSTRKAWCTLGQLLNLADVPLFFGVVWASIKWIPLVLTRPYELFLLLIGPSLTILEGLAALEIILDIGPVYGDRLAELSTTVKTLVLMGCGAAYAMAGSIITWILRWHQEHGSLTPKASALVAIVSTLLVVLSFATIVCEHGLITDSVLLTLYSVYDLGWISREWPWEQHAHVPGLVKNFWANNGVVALIQEWLMPSLWYRGIGQWFDQKGIDSSQNYSTRFNFSEWMETVHAMVWFRGPLTHIHSLLSTLLSLLSPPIVLHLAVQMCIFVLAGRMFTRVTFQTRKVIRPSLDKDIEDVNEEGNHVASASESQLLWDENPQEDMLDWIFRVWWPAYGRCILVLVYTHTWLMQERRADIGLLYDQNLLAFMLRPSTARWLNLAIVMVLYTKHLMTPPIINEASEWTPSPIQASFATVIEVDVAK